ncbi:DUF732 domain-containing protein [Nocardia sp. NPDC050406]|uniref:DUF732 domain-containing protein n=1 Tax=Nocardia sp. NPDC050406 TaxID=3364318 RepID=UPI003799252A
MNMRRVLVAAGLTAMIAAAGVGIGHAAPADPTERAFIEKALLNKELVLIPDEGLLEIGWAACAALDARGASVETVRGIIQIGKDTGAELETRLITAAAVQTLCTQHEVEALRAFAYITHHEG